MFCHDFVLGGGGAMVAMFTLSLAAQVGCCRVGSLLGNINYFRKQAGFNSSSRTI
jgi:hypothetical protein